MTTQQHVLDVVERALKTYVEAFLAAWALTGYALTKVAIGSALAAGMSVVWNVAIKVQNSINATTPTPQS